MEGDRWSIVLFAFLLAFLLPLNTSVVLSYSQNTGMWMNFLGIIFVLDSNERDASIPFTV